MYSLGEFHSRLATQYHLAFQWISKLGDFCNATIPRSVPESISTLLVRVPTFDRQELAMLWERTRHQLHLPAYELVLPEMKVVTLPANLVLAVLPLTLGLILLLFLSLRRPQSRPVGAQDLHSPLIALMTVIAPTTSTWPANYLHIARRGLSSGKHVLVIPLRTLYDDYVSGSLEFRSDASELPNLMANMHRTQDWRIELNAEVSWWIALLFNMTLSRFACLVPRFRPTLPTLQEHPEFSQSNRDTSYSNDDSQERQPILSEACLLQSAATGGRATFILDAVPYARVHAYIRAFQFSLPPNTPVMFGLSTLGPSVSLFSTSFVVAAIPFLPKKYIMKHRLSSGSDRFYPPTCRTITPLMTSLDYILKALTSGPAPLVIESVQNVSEQYADYLRQHVQDLTNNASVRARFIARWDVEGWREERLITAWEESLCRAGLLSRWLILARK